MLASRAIALTITTMLSGCLTEEEWFGDGSSEPGGYDDWGDDCDCEDDYFSLVPSDSARPLAARPR